MAKSWLKAVRKVCILGLLFGTALAQSDDFPLPEGVGDTFSIILLGSDGAEVEWTYEEYLTQPRCLSHSLLVTEQGFLHSGTDFLYSGTDFLHSETDFFHSGTTGGVVIGANEYVTPRDVATVLDEIAPRYLQTNGWTHMALGELMWQEPRAGDVVIVVLDDFGEDPPVYSLPKAAFTLKSDDREQFRALVDEGKISHGALVMHFLNALIHATGNYDIGSTSTEDRVVWERKGSTDARLIVSAYNLRDHSTDRLIDTGNIAQGLGAAVETAYGQAPADRALNGIVVNMSWVLLPCPTVAAFVESTAAGQFQTFEEYIERMKAIAPGDSWILEQGLSPLDIVRALSWVSTNNDLYAEISSILNDRNPSLLNTRIGFVAAAGNFRLPYQMLPAAWPAVVGVGAPILDAPLPPFSNNSEVVAPGAWFAVKRVLPWEIGSGGEMALAGTSYSAPVVSLFTAIDIADESRCTPALYSGDLPRLRLYPLRPAWLANAAYGEYTRCAP